MSPSLSGQDHTELRVRDGSGLPFKLRVDGEWVDNEGKERYRVDSLVPGEHRFEVSYPDTGLEVIENTLQLEAGVSRSYVIRTNEEGGRSWEMISEIRRKSPDENEDNGDTVGEAMNEVREGTVDSAFISDYKGDRACPDPIRASVFDPILEEVEGKTFEKDRFRIAKKRIADHCLLSAQIRELMLTLDYEENRLDLAKYAYGKTFDQDQYQTVKEALHFKSSKRELDAYLQEAR